MQLYDLFECLLESAQSDLDMHQKATAIKTAVIRHFMRPSETNYDLTFGKSKDNHYCVISGKNSGISGEGSDIRFVFRNDEKRGGAFNPHNNIIIISVKSNITPDNTTTLANEIKNDPELHKALQHEIIHYLDNKRNPAMKKIEVPPKGVAYFNSPHEMNAYINNILEPLLTFVSQAKIAIERGLPHKTIERIADQKHILPSFHETMNLLYAASEFSVGAGFIEHMDERSKRSLLRRAHALHYEAMQLLDQKAS